MTSRQEVISNQLVLQAKVRQEEGAVRASSKWALLELPPELEHMCIRGSAQLAQFVGLPNDMGKLSGTNTNGGLFIWMAAYIALSTCHQNSFTKNITGRINRLLLYKKNAHKTWVYYGCIAILRRYWHSGLIFSQRNTLMTQGPGALTQWSLESFAYLV